MNNNIFWHDGKISREDRIKLLGLKNKVLWFTGLSGSGKSTLAVELEKILHEKGISTYILDGDNLRRGLNYDLGFLPKDRSENIRRVAEVAKLMYDAGIFVIVCLITPYAKDRTTARKIIGEDFIEIFVDCPLHECEKRDKKGLYKLVREGKISEFTGITAPYEIPEKSEIVINTYTKDINSSMGEILNFIFNKKC